MFCRRCGAQIPEDSSFCVRCGTPTLSTETPGNPPVTGEQFFPPPTGEQFSPPPPWQGAPSPTSGWVYPPRMGPYAPPSRQAAPQTPPLERIIGPRRQRGAPLNHRDPVQRGPFSQLPPSLASSFWFGAIIGPLIAFVIVLLLSIAFSLTLGPTLDQNSSNVASSLADTANAGQPGQDTSSSTVHIALYSNPLLLLASANQSKMVENITEGLAGDGSQAGVAVTGAVSSTAPTTLLLIIPAIGLIIGGYLAASTDYTERRRFSIIRGASICLLYALLTLIASLFASGSLAAKSTTDGLTVALSGTITADAVSVFFNALLWGAIFGAFGGYLRAWAFPQMPHSRLYERIRGTLVGAGAALGAYFVLCLLLVIILYILGQLFTPSLLNQSSSSTVTTGGLCSALASSSSASAQPTGSSDFARYIAFIIGSPSLAFWLMALSMGAPIQISGAVNLSIGLFGADCQLGSGGILYALLLIPAAALFLGGWVAARSARPRTTSETAGVGLLMAGALAIFMLLFTFFASSTISEHFSLNLSGLGTAGSQVSTNQSVSEGPAIGGIIIASLLFGSLFGVLGSLVGRQRNLPPLQPSVSSAWPAAPAWWPPAPQTPVPPIYAAPASGVAPPASAGPGLTALGNQPTRVNPTPPDTPPLADAPGAASGSADTPT